MSQDQKNNGSPRAFERIDAPETRAPQQRHTNRNTTKTKQQKTQPAQGQRGAAAQKSAAVNKQNTNAFDKAAMAKVVKRRPEDGQGGTALKVIPLGGIGEIGKNMTLFQYGGDSFIVDCGLSFPDDELFGVDIVIPDFSYIEEVFESIRGIVITHGHEDHIGALPYFLSKYNIPVHGTKLTVGLIKSKLAEHKLDNKVKLNVIDAGQSVRLGAFKIEAIRVNHSIPDAVALAIKSPAGVVIHTGDFKIDYTPVFGETIDLTRLAQLGNEGVLALMSDSTNAERPGSSVTERNVGQALENLFTRADGKRLIIASFASNIQRIQQIIDLAQRHGRKIALSGRSMENYTEIALELGYLKVSENVIIDISDVNKYRASDLIIVTTGSQGEPMSALSRMASGMHRQISISHNDMIIISATPIPGNERTIDKVINDLLKLGSDVYYESMYEAHASGHACQDELKLIIKLTKPRFFIPVHGEYKHLVKHTNVARAVGIPNENIIIPEIGRVMEFRRGKAHLGEMVPAGRVLVDGFGVGDVGSTVLRDRKHLSQDGLMAVIVCIEPETREIISGPDIISRGFVYVRESEPLMDEAKELVRDILDRWSGAEGRFGRNDLKLRIREELSKLLYQRTKRSPMILPVIMEV